MLSYFENEKFEFEIDDNFPELSEEERWEIKKFWQEKKKMKNIFNGGIYCANKIVEENGKIKIRYNKSDYATYLYFRSKNLVKRGVYAMGVGVFVFDQKKDGWVFTVRNDNLAFDGGTYCLSAGGVVDYPIDNKKWNEPTNFNDYLLNQIKKELSEELIYKSMTKPKMLGAYVDNDSLKIEFIYAVVGEECEINTHEPEMENVKSLIVNNKFLKEFYESHKNNMETSTLNHLKRWIDKMDKIELFE